MVSYADAALLLRRAGFGGTRAEIEALTPLNRSAMVEAVLDVSGAPPATRPGFLSENHPEWKKGFFLQLWWLDRMRTSTAPLQEKMTLFWHGHFATSMDKVYDAPVIYEQNALFRSAGLGGFRPLVQAMSIQPAMLRYLDNDPNVKGRANENFARELMELFTLGVDEYTQDDVAAAARAWTGHNTDDKDDSKYRFYPDRHDNGDKTFMGVTRNWDGPEIIDHITTVEPHKTTCARFIATKVWSYFAYEFPEASVVDDVAGAFHASDLDVTALLRAVFEHDAFYSERSRGGRFRNPTEWVVAAMRATGLASDVVNPPWWMEDMGQSLFYPPNVSGWRLNGAFISSTTTWARMNFARHVTWKWRTANSAMLSGTTSMTVPEAIDTAYEMFGIDNPSPETRADLETWLTNQRADNKAWRDLGFINLVTLMLLSPDFNNA